MPYALCSDDRYGYYSDLCMYTVLVPACGMPIFGTRGPRWRPARLLGRGQDRVGQREESSDARRGVETKPSPKSQPCAGTPTGREDSSMMVMDSPHSPDHPSGRRIVLHPAAGVRCTQVVSVLRTQATALG